LINRIQFGGDEVVKAKGKLFSPHDSSGLMTRRCWIRYSLHGSR